MSLYVSKKVLLAAIAGMASCCFMGPAQVSAQAVAEAPAQVEGEVQQDMGGPSAKMTAEEYRNRTREEILKQVSYDIKYLASDELGGRQPGTPGMKLTEDFLISEYKKAGIEPCGDDGTYLQTFNVRGQGRKIVKDTVAMKLNGPNSGEIVLEMGENAQPLNSRFNMKWDDAQLVFAGYGINAKNLNYNDYKDQDLDGKIAVIIRREPQQESEDSVFDGIRMSRYASITTKVSAARAAGAAGIILVNDGVSASDDERDELVAADQFGNNGIPFLHVKRSVMDEILLQAPIALADSTELNSLAKIEKHIDEKLEPLTQPIEGWSANCTVELDNGQIPTSNIVGVIEGEGPHADETIVIGGHYDHLGLGEYGSRAPGRKEIHNGADDNATGTAGIIELIRRFKSAEKKPARRLVFICFTAEEMGLLGAMHYCDNPIYPLDKTVAMINFDMIGWLRDDVGLTAFDWNSSEQFEPVLTEAMKSFEFKLNKPARGFGGSDHLPFRSRNIPVMFIHTGLTNTYHTPEDDYETINCDGALTVIEFTEKVIAGIADIEGEITYANRSSAPRRNRFRLGVMIEDENEMVKIAGVTDDSVASKAGLQEGDVIISIGDDKITARRDLNRILQRDKGKTVDIKVKREDTEMTLKVLLKDE